MAADTKMHVLVVDDFSYRLEVSGIKGNDNCFASSLIETRCRGISLGYENTVTDFTNKMVVTLLLSAWQEPLLALRIDALQRVNSLG